MAESSNSKPTSRIRALSPLENRSSLGTVKPSVDNSKQASMADQLKLDVTIMNDLKKQT